MNKKEKVDAILAYLDKQGMLEHEMVTLNLDTLVHLLDRYVND